MGWTSLGLQAGRRVFPSEISVLKELPKGKGEQQHHIYKFQGRGRLEQRLPGAFPEVVTVVRQGAEDPPERAQSLKLVETSAEGWDQGLPGQRQSSVRFLGFLFWGH